MGLGVGSSNNLQPIGALTAQVNFDPAAVLDFQVDWSNWLGSDTILTSEWTLAAPMTQPFGDQHNATTATIWVTGGNAGTTAKAVNHIVTAGGRQEDGTLLFNILSTF